jgi:hypothetical protein
MERSDTMEPELQPLKRIEATAEEKIHDRQIEKLQKDYPHLDNLMCSVLLKCPTELLAKLVADPSMWVIPEASSVSVSGMVSVSDPEPTSPRSVLS